MKKKKNKIYGILYYWLPFLLWVLLIYSFSSHPTNPVSEVYWEDFVVKKLAHIVEYGILTLFLYRALIYQGLSKKSAGIISLLFAVCYGFTDEHHQSFVPGREPRLRDVFFDTIGALLAIFIIWKLLPKAPKRLRSWAKSMGLT